MLQFPTMTKNYGSVRNIWEGSVAGEGILSEIKPLIRDLRSNWHINAGLCHHRLKSMKKVINAYLPKEETVYIPTNHCTYDSIETIIGMFHAKKPLSLMCIENKRYILSLDSDDKYVEVVPESFCKFHFGMPFWNWVLLEDIKDIQIELKQVKHYCLLLPLLQDTRTEHERMSESYGLITSDWLEMNIFGEIVHPTFMNSQYSHDNEPTNNDGNREGELL